MGCDIHIFAETKQLNYWWATGPFWENVYYNPESAPTSCNQSKTSEPYSGRSYDLFALLADVRNGYGFAGCDTGDRIEPISAPRGLPDDVDDETKKLSDEWGCDGHSHSYFTLKELIDARVQRQKITRGWVSSEEFVSFKENGVPSSWSGGVTGRRVEHISNAKMQERIDAGACTGHEYTQVEFPIDLTTILDPLIDNLKMLLPFVDNDPERVRAVFWFDN